MSLIGLFAPYALPFGVALALASLLRLVGGAETGARLAGVALPAGFLAAWALFRGVSLAPRDVLDLALHVALGGALLGLVLDALRPRPVISGLAAAVFAVVCVWAAADFPLRLTLADGAWLRQGVAALMLLTAWALALGRLAGAARTAEGQAEATASLAGLAAGVALVAVAAGVAGVTGATAGDSGLARPAGGLAMAALGLLAVMAAQSGAGLRLGMAGLLGGGGALLALAQALVVLWPVTAAPLAVLGLGLFAGPTARRLPGPPTVTPLWTLVLTLLVGLLAGLLMLALGETP